MRDLVQYSAVQYSTVQYSTVQYSTVQYSVCTVCVQVQRVLGRCIETEREVTVIVTKCHADMGAAVASMEVENDINLIVDINKSGKIQLLTSRPH